MPETIGQRIRRKRGESGFTQAGAASAAGIGLNSLKAWEKGDWPPTIVPLTRLAVALNTSVRYLETGDE